MPSPPPKYRALVSPDSASGSPSVRPEPVPIQGQQEASQPSNSTLRPESSTTPLPTKKKRNHRGGKKKRNRRQSFAAPSDNGSAMGGIAQSGRSNENAARNSFYIQHGRNLSNTSLESEALLDHREQSSMRPRRSSVMAQTAFNSSYRQSQPMISETPSRRRPRTAKSRNSSHDDAATIHGDERTPLIGPAFSRTRSSQNALLGYGTYGGDSLNDNGLNNHRRASSRSSRNSKKRTIFDKTPSGGLHSEEYNVNYPPSVPGSPHMGAMDSQMSFGPDAMIRDDFEIPASIGDLRDSHSVPENAIDDSMAGSPLRPRLDSGRDARRHTIAMHAEEDVCFPIEGMSELGLDDEMPRLEDGAFRRSGDTRRRRGKKWPDMEVLDDWSKFEKEGRSEERRAKKITEPQLIGGRLRPIHKGWHRAEDDAPYRFTYFNEEFQSTIHSQTISELVQPGGSFEELFIPEPRVLDDSSSDEDEDEGGPSEAFLRHTPGENGLSRVPTRQGSVIERPESRRSTLHDDDRINTSNEHSGQGTPQGYKSPNKTQGFKEKPKRYGDRPTWWLDVLSPTEAEMKVLSKTFGIHPLTAEDILMQEAREKVELFRNYYFVNYRTFEQDQNNEDFLEPVNMYVAVFREGVISFHFSMTPHPANVRRRIRQLKDYLILSSDWISYAIIDDITDVFAPLIQNIEDEVDDIDDAILMLHSVSTDDGKDNNKDSENPVNDGTTGESGGDMLRRVGACRKKVMGLYRLLGNKADVIKGFAKRCNEHWEVAPRSEIGLYLGDIQDHIVTMTGNLSHYEKILARSHGNYLAQINIRMNERQEQTADVLGRLTVLGTIVLPMNIITGLWGMNVWVPGQNAEGDLTWFACITAGLLIFGLACFYVAKLMYRIV